MKTHPHPFYPFGIGVLVGAYVIAGALLLGGCSGSDPMGDAGGDSGGQGDGKNDATPKSDAGSEAANDSGGSDAGDAGGTDSKGDSSGAGGSGGKGDRLPVPKTAVDRFGSPMYAATVEAFELDREEVTVGRFRKFVESGSGTQGKAPALGSGGHPSEPKTGWKWTSLLPKTSEELKKNLSFGGGTWSDAVGGNESLPVNGVSWSLAFAFCVWEGGRLPSQAEWNAAAVGGEEFRKYPWGDESPLDRASCSTCSTKTIVSGSTFPSGRGRWGHENLAGNLTEWTIDAAVKTPAPCGACVSPVMDGNTKVWLANGSYEDPDYPNLQGFAYSSKYPASYIGYRAIGFRCAR
jgi:formylglycine-generating enzyme required for sulfatase activity